MSAARRRRPEPREGLRQATARGHSSRCETRNARRCRNERLSSLHRRGRHTRSRPAVQQAEFVERRKDRHGAAERARNKGEVELRSIGRRSAIVEGRPKAAAVTAAPALHPRRPFSPDGGTARSCGPRLTSPRQRLIARGPAPTAASAPGPGKPAAPGVKLGDRPAVQRPAHLAPDAMATLMGERWRRGQARARPRWRDRPARL